MTVFSPPQAPLLQRGVRRASPSPRSRYVLINAEQVRADILVPKQDVCFITE